MADLRRQISVLQEENQRLKRAVRELSCLNELAQEIGSSLNSESIMAKVIKRAVESVQAKQGDVTLIDEKSTERQTLIRAMVSSVKQPAYHLTENLTGWMLAGKRPLVINDPRSDERFSGVAWPEDVKSVICVPLMVKSKLIGVLSVYNKMSDGGFDDDDERLLSIIAAQSAQVIETARLYEEERALLEVKEDLRLAAKIQEKLLPKAAPVVSGYDIAGKSLPAQQVGGDYFDFIKTDEADIAVGVGDVSGKGLPASLLMANLQATVRGQALVGHNCREIVNRSNKLIYRSTAPEKFATFFLCNFNSRKNLLCYTNAGHNPALLFPNGEDSPLLLKTGGIPLGIREEFSFLEELVPFVPGDMLVIYSDGITEALDSKEDEFGLDRLVGTIAECRDKPAQEVHQSILQAVSAHVGNAPQHDDITLLIVKRVQA